MAKFPFKKIIGFLLIATFLIFTPFANAQDVDDEYGETAPDLGGDETGADPGTNSGSTLQGRCTQMGKGGTPYEDFPDCASTPAECESNERGFHPLNCVYLEEPLGGQTGYDLYVQSCAPDPGSTGSETSGDAIDADKLICKYRLWYGEFITNDERGPLQAILAYEPGKEYQGPFGLIYAYLGVAYDFLSGIIVAVVVFIGIIGGVEIITAGGDSERASSGRKRILNALIGMALWFLASVILYTINPTFFRF